MANKMPVFATPLSGGVWFTSTPATVWPAKEPVFLASVVSGAPIWMSFTFCSDGVVGVPYSQDFDLSPALSPTTYTLVSGSLPAGLSLSNVSGDIGRLSGTPTTAGSSSFTLRATNSLGTADKAFTLVVASSGGGAFSFWA